MGPRHLAVARAGLKTPAGLAAPDPVTLIVESDLSRADVIARLERAIGEHRYSAPGRQSASFFRLGGSVADELVIVRARPYVVPGWIAGYGAMTIELRGQVIPSAKGSEIRGTVTAPVSWTTLAFLAFALIAWVLFGVRGNGSTWPVWIFFVLGSAFAIVVGLWVIRRNQRMALRNADELARIIRSVVAEPPTAAG